MPFRSTEGYHNGVVRASRLLLPFSSGRITAVTLSFSTDQRGLGGFPASALWGQIFLSSIETPITYNLFLLSSGRFGSFSSISWVGSIKSERDFVLRAESFGLDNCYLTLRILTELT
jgi:hypothetical protein